MAEFQEVMRQWGCRCEHCDAKENVHCYVHGDTCEAFRAMKDCTNFKLVEEEIMKWAAEHTEPVYPTWFEWLEGLGVVGRVPDSEPYITGVDKEVYMKAPAFRPKAFDPIPADIAEKLGVRPKEG